ncbi:tRNA lysidine(34) synthetase TilS [Marinilabiliaceae bacterium JC017]|nr:tRNA lysidine(34) synthetase TilS [Marinilabiliaceae bacterium JC017]
MDNCGIGSNDRLLVTVSGGADSMALLYLLKEAGYEIEVAHCNFHLRGTESDGDQQLVEKECDALNVPLHVNHFNTTEVASEKGISIEMAARELRYSWFEQMCDWHGLDWIVTGHHGDDMVETFLLNLCRGTGIRGLSGIKARKGRVIRPFLSFSRKEIEAYVKSHNISYRDDSTNSDVRYIRNKIRHEIVPRFKEINPSFFQTMQGNLDKLHEVEELFESEVEKARSSMVVEEHGRVLIPVSSIRTHPQKKSILFEVLRPYGFNASVIQDIIKSLDGIPGKQFHAPGYRLIRDRYNLILTQAREVDATRVVIDSDCQTLAEPVKMRLRCFDKTPDFKFSRDSYLVHFDADVVDFPLYLRHWEQGDVFMPLGMKGFKKLSDFFIDIKLSVADKEQAWLLQTGDDIAWIIGHRLDDRYKVTNRTKRVLEIAVDHQ